MYPKTCRVRGRPHYYSTKKEEYAHIRFSLDADFSSLFTWNTKQIFVFVTAEWPSNTTNTPGKGEMNEAVVWDTIITSPSADHLQNIGAAAMKKLVRSANGKAVDPSRFVLPSSLLPISHPPLSLSSNSHSPPPQPCKYPPSPSSHSSSRSTQSVTKTNSEIFGLIGAS
jgi:hypothetical protein